jgi:hypothetical protein
MQQIHNINSTFNLYNDHTATLDTHNEKQHI